MTIQYAAGPERKKLAAAAATILGTKSIYAGMPSAAYIAGSYSLSKEWSLTGPDDRGLVSALAEQGFEPVEEAYDTTPVAESKLRLYRAELCDPECPDRMEIISAENDEDAVRQAYGFAAGGVVLLEINELDENFDIVRGLEIPPNRLVIEVPVGEEFTPAKMANLENLVASRATLLKKVLGADALSIERTDNSLLFPWFPMDGNVEVYSQLVCALVRTAVEATRITAKERPCESERFHMRTYLLKLGCIGPEYKQARKILTRGLSGNGSYAKAETAAAEPIASEETEAVDDE